MRSAVSILVYLALVFAFVQAPFSHVHEHENTQNHGGSLIHAHIPHLWVSATGTSTMEDVDPDDDARPQDWFAATTDFDQLTSWLSQQRIDLAPDLVSEPLDDTLVLSGHDPPENPRFNPRAPPYPSSYYL